MTRRDTLLRLGVVAAGVLAGAAVEELVFKRVNRRADPERDEPIGSLPGRTVNVESFDGARLHVRTYGPPDADGAIVFAHGITESLALWHYQLRDLRSDGRYKLVAYDARGHGQSGPVRGPQSTTPFVGDTLGLDLAAVVDQTTTGPVVLVGHSLGGMASLQFLVAKHHHPEERVKGAVIVNSTFTAQLRGWRNQGTPKERATERVTDIARFIAGKDARRIDVLRPRANDLSLLATRFWFGDDPSPRHMAVSFGMFDRTPSATLAAALDLHVFDVYALLPSIDVPTLVVSGSKDRITPAWLSREITAAIPGAELVEFDGCGHMSPFERHEELTAHIRKFADRVLG